MSSSTGKLSLLISFFITLIAGIVAFVSFVVAPPYPPGELVYIRIMVVMAIPFAVNIAGILPGAFLTSKKAKADSDGQDAAGQKSLYFFKSYLYLSLLLSLVVLVCGFLLYQGDFESHVRLDWLLVASLMQGAIWVVSVLLALIVSFAVSSWRSNELVSVILLALGAVMLYGSMTVIWIVCNDLAIYRSYDYPSGTAEGEGVTGSTAVDEEPEDYEEYSEDGMTYDYDAFRYLFAKLRLSWIENDPVGILRYFRQYSWKEYELERTSLTDLWYNMSDFNDCFRSFYRYYADNYYSEEGLKRLWDVYKKMVLVDENDVTITPETYRNSGLEFLVRALIASHDDIYSQPDYGSILTDMYLIMVEDVPEVYEDDKMVSIRYPKLREYMSDEVFESMKPTREYTTEWEHEFLAAWAYSFWARRNHSGMDGVSYRILKSIERLYMQDTESL